MTPSFVRNNIAVLKPMNNETRRRVFALWVLFGINPMNFYDRQILAAVAEPETRFVPSKIEETLLALDPDGMSPREAMDALYRLKGLLVPSPIR